MKYLIIVLFVSAFAFAACKQEKPKETNQQTSVSEQKNNDQNIIRSKDVKVSDIDVNKDNKVFQCPMDSDVISDKEGSCPKCKMDLEEVTVAEAEKNLR